MSKGAAESKVLTDVLEILVAWDPRGVNPIDRFKVVTAGLISDEEADRCYPGAPQEQNEKIWAIRPREAVMAPGTAYGRVCVCGKGTGVILALRGSFIMLVSGFRLEQTARGRMINSGSRRCRGRSRVGGMATSS